MNYEWYVIQVDICQKSPANVFVQNESNEMYVGPHTRPSGFDSAAMIESRELAESFVGALKPIFEKRYGHDTELTVVKITGSLREKHVKKMRTHSDIISARLATSNFAPNKRVVFT